MKYMYEFLLNWLFLKHNKVFEEWMKLISEAANEAWLEEE